MLMRYHWGLAVGHVYSHQRRCTNAGVAWFDDNPGVQSRDDSDEVMGLDEPNQSDEVNAGPEPGTDGSVSDSDSSDGDWTPSDTDDSQTSDFDDELQLDIDEMYGEGGSDDGYEG
jgi:hypothetical protein